MAFDVSKFLDELGATGEERTAVEKFFTTNTTAAQTVNGWRENGLRQSDYDRKMNLMKAEVDADRARVAQAEQTILATRDTMNGQYTQALADKEAAENRLAQTSARINRVAAEYNIPATEFAIEGTPAGGNPPANNPPARTPPQNQNDPQYASRQDFDAVFDLTKKLPFLQFDMDDIKDDYIELFGSKQGFNATEVVNKALELKRPVREVADMMYGISVKKAEAHDNKIRAEERAKADAEWKTKVSQNQVNPIRTDLQAKPGPVFELKRPEPNTVGIPGPRPDRSSSGVEAAVNAFREGKYRPQGQTA